LKRHALLTTPANWGRSVNNVNISLIEIAENCLDEGLGFDAAARFFVAAMSGDWEAWLRIVQLVEKGLSPRNDEISIFFRNLYYQAVESASAAGDKEAIRRMIGLCEFGRPGFQANPSRAIQFLIKLASDGDSGAQFELFEKYLYGLCDLVPDKDQAMHWLSLSASNGNVDAKDWSDRFTQWKESDFEYPKKP
jgi:hypothetical protein